LVFSVGADQDRVTESPDGLPPEELEELEEPDEPDEPELLDELATPLELEPPDELEPLELLFDAPELEPEADPTSGRGVTWIEKMGSETEVMPSVAAMMIFAYSPASAALGIPESSPVSTPKVAQAGLFWMLKISEVPAGLTELGRKL
jgi:hypothetical protein